jgi:peptidoglycan-associated lipoprotein
MARPYDMVCLAGAFGIVILVGTGCTRSIQANSGSKSFEQGQKRPSTIQTAAKPGGSSSSGSLGSGSSGSLGSGSRQPNGSGSDMGGRDAGGGGDAGKRDFGAPGSSDASGTSEPSVPIPSLSTMDSGTSLSTGKGSDDQRVPSDIMVAKTEPADAARRRVEEMQQEQLATAAAGLDDVFFGFDNWQISNEGKQTLMMNAEWLKANNNKSVMIEGHCDERGTLAYNLVLGEKRAKAVQKYLIELGVSPDRVRVVSYGKERPFCKDHDETCYQQNRRGHIVLRPQ